MIHHDEAAHPSRKADHTTSKVAISICDKRTLKMYPISSIMINVYLCAHVHTATQRKSKKKTVFASAISRSVYRSDLKTSNWDKQYCFMSPSKREFHPTLNIVLQKRTFSRTLSDARHTRACIRRSLEETKRPHEKYIATATAKTRLSRFKIASMH